MTHDVEVIVLNIVAMGLILVVLMTLADTPAYPIAFGIEIITILYFLIGDAKNPAGISINNLVATTSKFIKSPGSYAK
jgi:uncharacterized protein YebE (UPF0316 family)